VVSPYRLERLRRNPPVMKASTRSLFGKPVIFAGERDHESVTVRIGDVERVISKAEWIALPLYDDAGKAVDD
jgi:hypothetical protein